MERGNFYQNQAFLTMNGNEAAINIYLLTQMTKESNADLELLEKQLQKLEELRFRMAVRFIAATK